MKRILTILLALGIALCLPASAVERGIYTANIAVSDDALGLTDTLVMISDAGITVRVTATTGEGETLSVGGEEIQPSVNAAGEYVYTLPIAALDALEPIAWLDAEGAWQTFTLTVESEDMAPLGGAAAPEPAPEGPGAEALEDGSYAVADFAFSGGSGKVTISCESIRVAGGAATAVILFSSPRYGYVKVDGAQYDGEHTDDTSTFEIPVILNGDTRILGMTTAMSAPHEIEYTLRVVPGERLGD